MFVKVSMQDNKGRVGSLSFPSYFLCSTLCFIAAYCPLFPPPGTPQVRAHARTLTCTKHDKEIWHTFSHKHFILYKLQLSKFCCKHASVVTRMRRMQHTVSMHLICLFTAIYLYVAWIAGFSVHLLDLSQYITTQAHKHAWLSEVSVMKQAHTLSA